MAGGRFSGAQLVLWLVGGSILGLIAAWGAVIAQFYFAPLVLFPILVGVGLGAMLVGLMRVAQIGNRPTLFAGALLAALVAVAAQHYFSYREACLRWARQDAQTLEKARQAFPELLQQRGLEPPGSFLEYLQRQAAQGRPLIGKSRASGIAAWLSWAVEGLLVLMVTVGLMVPAARQPYCNRCRSWYRTIRSGRIAPATAQRLAEAVHATLGEHLKSARYRLSNCSGGCGPTRLELSWEESDGQTYLNTTWLDVECRDRVGRMLDEQ